MTDEQRTARGKIAANRIHTCPHCGKTGKSNAMFQWHFNNCKQFTDVISKDK